jgi:predicted nucleic acid-binding protein
MKVLVDTNILLDVLQQRKPFDAGATRVWKLVEERRVGGFVSAISFNNIFYVARKQVGRQVALEAVKLVRRTFAVVPTDESVIDRAIASELVDFEDAIQLAAVVAAGVDCIVTRNVRDFTASAVPAYTAEEALALYSS